MLYMYSVFNGILIVFIVKLLLNEEILLIKMFNNLTDLKSIQRSYTEKKK